jgi:hypothetical protein
MLRQKSLSRPSFSGETRKTAVLAFAIFLLPQDAPSLFRSLIVPVLSIADIMLSLMTFGFLGSFKTLKVYP